MFRQTVISQPSLARSLATSVKEVVIVSFARTPVGKFRGSLASKTAPELGAVAIAKAIENAGIEPNEIQEAIMGNVVSSGIGQAPCRQAVLGAGLPEHVRCTTLNKVCASGMKAVMMASQTIALGQRDVIVAGGMESMSNVPFYLPKARGGYGLGHQNVQDGIILDGLWDKYNNIHMGSCGEKTAKDLNITREQQDDYAMSSYRRAQNAKKQGFFDGEMAPVTIKGKRGKPDTIIATDEEYDTVDFEKLKKLPPAFEKDGTVTAGNASSLNDGAAALVLMSADKAKELGLKPIAKVVSYGDGEVAPIDFSIAPGVAAEEALQRAQFTADELTYVEVNEAFSVVPLAIGQILKIPREKMNVNGGGVSIGHPIGCSGARITGHLARLVEHAGPGSKGLAGICNGGGGASAIVVQAL